MKKFIYKKLKVDNTEKIKYIVRIRLGETVTLVFRNNFDMHILLYKPGIIKITDVGINTYL